MPDICDLVLDDHETLRRRFAELDLNRDDGAALARLWAPLATLLELHAAAEEAVFYPQLVRCGSRGDEETTDAIKDHNEIRDAVAEAGRVAPGGDDWWRAVGRARQQNSDHMAEEERGALPDARNSIDDAQRGQLGADFADFKRRHADGQGIDVSDKQPADYVAEHKRR